MKKRLLLLFLAPMALSAQTYDVLFLGNSYTAANNLPQMVSEIALSLGDTINYDSNTPGGCTLEGHTNNNTSMAKIAANAWDFVVIQAQSQEPSFSPAQVANDTYPYAAALVEAIAANDSCTEPLFYMTWGRKNGDQQNAQFYPIIGTYEGMQGRLRASYLEMGYTHNATVCPAGMAWKKSIETNPDFELYTADESHPNVAGTYLTACAFYTTIFQESCEGSDYFPASLSAEDAAYLQEIASSTVLDSTAVWNMFAVQSMDALVGDSIAFTAEASNADGYYWDFGDGNYSEAQNPTHTYAAFSEPYSVTLTAYSNGGCRSLSQELLLNPDTIGNGIETNSLALVYYPNPVSEQLHLELSEESEMKIYNALGVLIAQESLKGKATIDMRSYPNGVYVVQLKSKNGNKQFKLIKQ